MGCVACQVLEQLTLSGELSHIVCAFYYKTTVDIASLQGFLDARTSNQDLGSAQCRPLLVCSVAVIVDIEDIPPGTDTGNLLQNIIRNMPAERRSNCYAGNAHPSSEPDADGQISYAPNWEGVEGEAVEVPTLPLDQVDDEPIRSGAIECLGYTKKQATCRNMTRDKTGYCWRHRCQTIIN